MLAALVLLLPQADAPGPVPPRTRPVERVEAFYWEADAPSALGALEKEIQSLYRRLRPSLVQVRVPFLLTREDGRKVKEIVSVSGVLVGSEGILVAPGPIHPKTQGVQVFDRDGRAYPADLLQQDESIGLCLLKAEGIQFDPPPLGCASAMEIGSITISLGNGLDLDGTLDIGWLAGRGRQVAEIGGLLQITNDVNLGDGGGILADRRGQVVGILFTSLEEAARRHQQHGLGDEAPGLARSRGVSFAVPIDVVFETFQPYLGRPPFRRRFLGVEVVPAYVEIGGQQTGLLVQRVLPGSAAEAAGILRSDVLLRAAGRPTTTADQLGAVLSSCGRHIAVCVLRGAEQRNLEVRFAEDDTAVAAPKQPLGQVKSQARD